MKTTELINRSELITAPETFGVYLGKNPTSRLALYEKWGVIPKSIKIGGTGQGVGLKAFYPTMTMQMIRGIQAHQQEGKTLEQIRELFEKEYSYLYEMYDVLTLTQLRFFTAELLSFYLGKSHLAVSVQTKILSLVNKSADPKDVKVGILKLLQNPIKRRRDE